MRKGRFTEVTEHLTKSLVSVSAVTPGQGRKTVPSRDECVNEIMLTRLVSGRLDSIGARQRSAGRG